MRAHRLAIGLFFFGDGLLIGSWAGRIPAVQHHASLTNARLGLALFAASLGALVAMPLAGRLCERIGSRRVTLAALLLGSGSLFAASLATGLAGLAAALFGFGAGFGAINVSANAQGLALERLSGRSILSSFHAAFSAGGLVGAGHGGTRRRRRRSGRRCTTPRSASPSRRSALACVRFLLPPEADDQAERAAHLRAAAAGDRRARRGGILHDARGRRCRRLERRLPVPLVRSRGGRRGARLHRLLPGDDDEPDDRRPAQPPARAGDARSTGGTLATVGLGLALLIGSVPVAIAGFAAMGAGLGVVIPVPLPRRSVDAGRLRERRCRRRLDDRLVRLPGGPAGDRFRGLGRWPPRGPRDRRARDSHPGRARGQRRARPTQGPRGCGLVANGSLTPPR